VHHEGRARKAALPIPRRAVERPAFRAAKNQNPVNKKRPMLTAKKS
jgi:hypothetical protein